MPQIMETNAMQAGCRTYPHPNFIDADKGAAVMRAWNNMQVV